MTTATKTNRDIQCFTNETVTIPEELDILEDNEQIPAGRVCWRIMTKHDGDKRVVWDSFNIQQIAEAQKLFASLRTQGMTPFRVGVDGSKTSEEMKEFDPHAEEVIFIQMKHVIGG